MRDYGRVHSTFWSSQTTGPLSDDGKMLALYLMTCSHSTIAGVFRLPDGYVSEDLGWAPERVAKGFAELFAKGFANRCETTKWVWILKHLEWNPPENPNQRKAASKVACSVPDECGWKQAFMRACGEALGLKAPEKSNPSETVPKPFRNQEQEQEQKEKTSTASPRVGEGRFPEFWNSWPKTDRKQDRKKCAEKWARCKFDAQADVIVAHVEALKATKKWRDGFEPAPLTYLNGERWADGVEIEAEENEFAGGI
jgi:hypothetical protein